MNSSSMRGGYVPEESWKQSFLSSLLWCFPFAFALDFKGDAGGTLLQLLMGVVAVFLFVAIFLVGRVRALRPFALLLAASIGIIAIGFTMALYYSAPFENSIRAAFPVMMFASGLWAGSIAANSLRLSLSLFRGMISAGCLSLIFRFYYSTNIGGIDLDEMRYQLLTPVLCSLIAYVCAVFTFSSKLNVKALLVSVGITVIIALSVTRVYVLTFAWLLVGLPLIVYRLGARNPKHAVFLRWRKIGAIFAVSGAVLGLGVAIWLRPAVIETWIERLLTARVLTRSGVDINYITRLAEAEGIWRTVSETPESLILGKGFGNSYQWAYEYVGEAASVSPDMVYAFWAPTWVPGHSPFTYALFFGGLLGLAWQILVFIAPLVSGWRLLLLLRTRADEEILRLAAFNLLSVYLYFSQSFTANPFGERLSGLYMGLSAGMIISLPKLLRTSELPQKQQATT